MSIPPPSDKPKKDTSENVFDYICNRLRYSEKQRAAVLECLEEGASDFEALEELEED